MDKLRKSVENFVSLENLIADGSSSFFHRVVAGMHDLCSAILDAERNGIPRAEIDEIIRPARDIHRRSVFVKRLQDWPRKYPGDFETIEYLCNLDNKSQYGRIEYYIEEYAINSAIAQQHRNKVQHQSEIILDMLLNGKTAQKILSVGCGGCRDILKIAKYISDIKFDLVLHDIDGDALELSRKRLENLRGRVHLVNGNFLQSMRKIEKSGPFNLILTGGLFFFTNIKKENPYKVWQEYLADWKLVYRSEDNIVELLTTAGFSDSAIKIEKDETGLTFLVTARR
jgi:SAM-dependent methyltransferase